VIFILKISLDIFSFFLALLNILLYFALNLSQNKNLQNHKRF